MARAVRGALLAAGMLVGLLVAPAARASLELAVPLPAPGELTVVQLVVEVDGAAPPRPKLQLANRARLATTVAVAGGLRARTEEPGRFDAVVVLLRGCGRFAGGADSHAALRFTVPAGWNAAAARPPGVRVWKQVRARTRARFELAVVPAAYLSRYGLTRVSAGALLERVRLLGRGRRADQDVIALLSGLGCAPAARPQPPQTPRTAPSFAYEGLSLTFRVNSTGDADICLTWATKPAQRNAAATITVAGPGGTTTARSRTNAQGRGSAKVNVKANFGTPLAVPVNVSLLMQEAAGPLIFSSAIDVGPLSTRPGTCTL